jgi:hypothetical protein
MTTSTRDEIAAEAAELQAKASQAAAQLAAIDQAETDARRATEVAHYHEAASTTAHDYRDRRDAAKANLDKRAGADAIHLNELFDAFLEFKRLDAECAALHTHASRINYVDPKGRNQFGVDQSHVIACGSLYEKLTWSSYLDWVVAERVKRARSQHGAELEAGAHAKIAAAGQQARDAAAGG